MGRIKAVIAKAEPSRDGKDGRNSRHIMADDSDINATRHARALVGGVLASVIGCTDLFVSGGAEHQGPGRVAGRSPSSPAARRPGRRSWKLQGPLRNTPTAFVMLSKSGADRAAIFLLSRPPERHMWTAPSSQGWAASRSDRLRSYVRPVVALFAHERWPRWVPRREFQTSLRPGKATAVTGLSPVGDRSITSSAFCSQVWHRLSRVVVEWPFAWPTLGSACQGGRRGFRA